MVKTVQNNYNKIKSNSCSRNVISKIYTDKKRYFCELRNIRKFHRKGFRVPSIVSYDSNKMVIVFKKINGLVTYKFDKKKIEKCINILTEIIHKFGIKDKKTAAANLYIRKLKSNILTYSNELKIKLNMEKFNNALQKIKQVCYISIFKDAKTTNWIFKKNMVFLSDFDYIRNSFFLTDLAQLLTYVMIYRKISIKKYLRYFLKRTDLKTINLKRFFNPFILAMINSNIMSMKNNINLTKKITEGFKKQNLIFLSKLNLIE